MANSANKHFDSFIKLVDTIGNNIGNSLDEISKEQAINDKWLSDVSKAILHAKRTKSFSALEKIALDLEGKNPKASDKRHNKNNDVENDAKNLKRKAPESISNASVSNAKLPLQEHIDTNEFSRVHVKVERLADNTLQEYTKTKPKPAVQMGPPKAVRSKRTKNKQSVDNANINKEKLNLAPPKAIPSKKTQSIQSIGNAHINGESIEKLNLGSPKESFSKRTKNKQTIGIADVNIESKEKLKVGSPKAIHSKITQNDDINIESKEKPYQNEMEKIEASKLADMQVVKVQSKRLRSSPDNLLTGKRSKSSLIVLERSNDDIFKTPEGNNEPGVRGVVNTLCSNLFGANVQLCNVVLSPFPFSCEAFMNHNPVANSTIIGKHYDTLTIDDTFVDVVNKADSAKYQKAIPMGAENTVETVTESRITRTKTRQLDKEAVSNQKIVNKTDNVPFRSVENEVEIVTKSRITRTKTRQLDKEAVSNQVNIVTEKNAVTSNPHHHQVDKVLSIETESRVTRTKTRKLDKENKTNHDQTLAIKFPAAVVPNNNVHEVEKVSEIETEIRVTRTKTRQLIKNGEAGKDQTLTKKIPVSETINDDVDEMGKVSVIEAATRTTRTKTRELNKQMDGVCKDNIMAVKVVISPLGKKLLEFQKVVAAESHVIRTKPRQIIKATPIKGLKGILQETPKQTIQSKANGATTVSKAFLALCSEKKYLKQLAESATKQKPVVSSQQIEEKHRLRLEKERIHREKRQLMMKQLENEEQLRLEQAKEQEKRRQAEEAKQKEIKRLKEQKRLKEIKSAPQVNKPIPKPAYLTGKAPLLPTADCYDSDEDHKNRQQPLPSWNKSGFLKEYVAAMACIDSRLKNTFFMCQPQSIYLPDVFPDYEGKKVHRNSSAIWDKELRFSILPNISQVNFDDE